VFGGDGGDIKQRLAIGKSKEVVQPLCFFT
jgi:hypothetical protein